MLKPIPLCAAAAPVVLESRFEPVSRSRSEPPGGTDLPRECVKPRWRGDKRSLVVTDAAAQVDVDALGIDLGLGTPLVAFQVKCADVDCCRTFLIYSLQKPPKLLRTITGGSFFSAADAELDGRIEIWDERRRFDRGVSRPQCREAGSSRLPSSFALSKAACWT